MLYRLFTRLAGADANDLGQRRNKDFAIADFTGGSRLGNRLDGAVDHIGPDGNFKLDLGQKINHILGTTVEFGVPLLAPKALYLGPREQ